MSMDPDSRWEKGYSEVLESIYPHSVRLSEVFLTSG